MLFRCKLDFRVVGRERDVIHADFSQQVRLARQWPWSCMCKVQLTGAHVTDDVRLSCSPVVCSPKCKHLIEGHLDVVSPKFS